MKLIFIFLALICLSKAQIVSISCEFTPMTINNNQEYGCWLTISNSIGFDNFLIINGAHTFGFSNENVTILLREAGTTSIVPRIICDRFPNLKWAEFSNYRISSLSETSFGGCESLEVIELNQNSITEITDRIFERNSNLINLDLSGNLITSLSSSVFQNNQNLETVNFANNRLTSLPNEIFDNLTRLRILNLQTNQITSLENVFGSLPSLERLYLYENNLTVLAADSFGIMENLIYLDLSSNPLINIENGAFRSLGNLEYFYAIACQLRNLNSDSFEGLTGLLTLNLNFNELENLPTGIFRHFERLFYLSLWGNRLKTLKRDQFGDLSFLTSADFDNNVINAIERNVIEDATNLNALLLSENLCASGIFSNFSANRVQHMERLQRCFRNFELSIETTTDNNANYEYHSAPEPGIQFRVLTDNIIHIALSPSNTTQQPLVEIFIGTANNTRSSIRWNQEQEVALVPTPEIIRVGQWNGFRISWANHVVLVSREGEQFPFMVFTIAETFDVNFFGLRTPESRGEWSIQPVDL
ncbi:hypothetical protein PVAND_016493 [Polypedilum vanderplanki]|uniref:Farnesoic acid O-methyl transferase domain-containing protein n=1 Tax=Polypedilum vanderplanki TaxID=319348 RepID=A0A9J6BGC4_POLVA|nr:hypothetical protein PVAND_016493 [Polypedilum vanderplanki]